MRREGEIIELGGLGEGWEAKIEEGIDGGINDNKDL